jgi:hypothetical protein
MSPTPTLNTLQLLQFAKFLGWYITVGNAYHSTFLAFTNHTTAIQQLKYPRWQTEHLFMLWAIPFKTRYDKEMTMPAIKKQLMTT